ncbi:MAG: SymE family type I addiction module toxin [Bacillota bacterium]|nr:SymE family type I addiction module toxin [Bacillota bacterium]
MIIISQISGFWLEDDTPLINITGKWLKEFGFDIGKNIVIEAVNNQITIKVASDTE